MHQEDARQRQCRRGKDDGSDSREEKSRMRLLGGVIRQNNLSCHVLSDVGS